MKSAKKNNCFQNHVLTISKFLGNYYNVEGFGLNKLTHRQMKEIFDLKSYPNERITDNSVIEGKTLLVKDSEGVILGYKNPLLNKSDKECMETFENSTKLDVKNEIVGGKVLKDDNLGCYSDYELGELIKICKRHHDNKSKNLIIKELHKRKYLENNTKGKKLAKVRKRELGKE